MMWSLVRFLHLAAVAMFVGGQLTLAVAVAPAIRRHGTEAAMRMAARRFGAATGVAVVVLAATGAAMAAHESLWGASVLHAKLAAIVVVILLTGAHVRRPRSRPLSYAVAASSLLVVWLGVRLAHGG